MTTQLQTRTQTAVALRGLVDQPAYQARFKELLRDRAPQFVASMVQLVNASPQLQNCDPQTVIAAAITAAALDLPIEKNLGFAHIVPYGQQAQFQMGYKGYIQLAIRTGQYRFINVTPVYDGELQRFDRLTSEMILDAKERKSDEIVGYAAYFKLVNGFEHAEYWDKETVLAHAKRYSKAFNSDKSPWQTDFDKMALKTVIKSLISHWGILSIEMQRALSNDQSVNEDGTTVFPDSTIETPRTSLPEFAPRADGAPKDVVLGQPTPAARRGRKPKPTESPAPSPEPPQAAVEPPEQPIEPPQQQETLATPEERTFEQIVDGTPVEDSPEVATLRSAMTTYGVTEAQVLKFCAEKKVNGKDGTLPKALADLKHDSITNLTKHFTASQSNIAPQIKATAV